MEEEVEAEEEEEEEEEEEKAYPSLWQPTGRHTACPYLALPNALYGEISAVTRDQEIVCLTENWQLIALLRTGSHRSIFTSRFTNQ